MIWPNAGDECDCEEYDCKCRSCDGDDEKRVAGSKEDFSLFFSFSFLIFSLLLLSLFLHCNNADVVKAMVRKKLQDQR